MTKRKLISKMAIVRGCHAALARQQASRRRAGLPKGNLVGGETFHRKWTQVYDAAIKRLEK